MQLSPLEAVGSSGPACDVVSDTLAALVRVLKTAGVEVTVAHEMQAEAMVRACWGGQRVYIPKAAASQAWTKSLRNMAIWQGFQGGLGTDALAERFGLTERRVRQILSAHRARAVSEMTCVVDFRTRRYDEGKRRLPRASPVPAENRASLVVDRTARTALNVIEEHRP